MQLMPNISKLKIALLCGLCLAVMGLPQQAFSQAGNPFARPAPTPPPAPKAPSAPVPSLPTQLLAPDDNLRDDFSSFTLVAVSEQHAVLRADETVYYLRSGDYFKHGGNRIRANVSGNKLQLFSEKDGESDEIFSSEVGNGVVTSRTAPAAKKPAEKPAESGASSNFDAANPDLAAASTQPPVAVPGVTP